MRTINDCYKNRNFRVNQINYIEKTIKTLENYLQYKYTKENEFETNYIKQSIGQLKKFKRWLKDEIPYIDEDILFVDLDNYLEKKF